MKKLLLLFLAITIYNTTFAQYESALNDTSRYWKVYNYRAFFGLDIFADSMYLGKDSVINNITYRELHTITILEYLAQSHMAFCEKIPLWGNCGTSITQVEEIQPNIAYMT